MHECIDMIRTFEQESEVSLQFAMVGCKKYVSVCRPLVRVKKANDVADGLINKLVFDMRHRVDFTDLVSCHVGWDKFSWRFKIGPK